MPKFRLHSPASIPGVGSLLEIPGEDVSVGRNPDSQLVIPDSSVSLCHARLRKTPEGWLLTENPESNGIWVGVKRVPELLLCPGQLFRIGGVALEFVEDAGFSAVPQPVAEVAPDKTEQDSGIRELTSAELGPETPAGPPASVMGPETPADPSASMSRSETPAEAPASMLGPKTQVDLPASILEEPESTQFDEPQPAKGTRVGRVLLGLLGLMVLGTASAFGGYFALRWMNQHQTRVRPPAALPTQTPTASAVAPQGAPDSLLMDREVADVSQEQQLEVPNALKIVLPGRSLHTPTHLVVARAGRQGTPFCGATDYAGSAYEISTLSNMVWAQPASVEMTVDVEQLAKTRVPAVAVGIFDSTKQVWSLLPTEYDSIRRVAKAQLWQPGIVGLFMVSEPETFASSEHFSLLVEPSRNPARPGRVNSGKALAQLESALSSYRAAGYRVPNGSLWVCASRSAISRARALLPVVHESELGRARSHALGRAAFLSLIPAYLGSRALDGREFWFDAMVSAIASQGLGQHPVINAPGSKRLANSLLADDWPSSPYFVGVLNRIVDGKIDLFRLWTDTTHVMNELDAKPNAEMQSRVLPIDLALQQATQKNLLAYQSSLVMDRLSSVLTASAANPSASAEFCSSPTHVREGQSGIVKLDVPNQYSARWTCLVFEVAAGKYRSVHLSLGSEPLPDSNVQWIRATPGQAAEAKPLSMATERIDLQASQLLIIAAVNSNMAQSRSIAVRYDDVTLEARFEVPSPTTIRPGQIASTVMQLSKIPADIKAIEVEWDFGDGSPKVKNSQAVNSGARIEQSHAWDRAGAFTLRAIVFDHERPQQPLAMATREFAIQLVRLELSASDPSPPLSTEVQFKMRPSGPSPENAQIRLDFGDGSEPRIVSSLEAAHAFSAPGEYTVTAQILGDTSQNEVLAVAKTLIVVKPAEAPPPSPSVDPQPVPPPPASSPSVQ